MPVMSAIPHDELIRALEALSKGHFARLSHREELRQLGYVDVHNQLTAQGQQVLDHHNSGPHP